MTLKVHFPKAPARDTLAELLPLLPPTVEVTTGPEQPQPVDCEILVAGTVTPEQLAVSPGLRAVIVPFAGVPVETQQLLRAYPAISLHNLHFNDIPTAEMALALLFAASKHLVPLDRQFRLGDWRWDDDANPTDVFAGKTAVILGYGAIGHRLAPVCQALGMQVIGVRRNEPPTPIEQGVQVFAWTRLADLLPRADVLLCILPETPETTGLLDARALALLPAHCLLVNVGRGRVIDEEALYLALRDRRIKAAGLDVWYTYPRHDEERSHTFPSRFPFHELDNVVMTPHRAGWLYNFEHLRGAALAELLIAAAEGRGMPNAVNKELGY